MENTKKKKKAFPVIRPRTGAVIIDSGMTLRDYFAGQAMQGMVANHVYGGEPYEGIADAAYRHADAMLKVRKPPADKKAED